MAHSVNTMCKAPTAPFSSPLPHQHPGPHGHCSCAEAKPPRTMSQGKNKLPEGPKEVSLREVSGEMPSSLLRSLEKTPRVLEVPEGLGFSAPPAARPRATQAKRRRGEGTLTSPALLSQQHKPWEQPLNHRTAGTGSETCQHRSAGAGRQTSPFPKTHNLQSLQLFPFNG